MTYDWYEKVSHNEPPTSEFPEITEPPCRNCWFFAPRRVYTANGTMIRACWNGRDGDGVVHPDNKSTFGMHFDFACFAPREKQPEEPQPRGFGQTESDRAQRNQP